MGQDSNSVWQLSQRGGNRMFEACPYAGALRRRELLAQQPLAVKAGSDIELLPGRYVMRA